jgi:hypothetical protein
MQSAICQNEKTYLLFLQTDPQTNQTRVVSTALRQNSLYVSLYVFWSKFVFIELIPYITILIMNIFIIIKITKSRRFRKKFQRQYTEEPDLEVGAPNGDTSSDCSRNNDNHRDEVVLDEVVCIFRKNIIKKYQKKIFRKNISKKMMLHFAQFAKRLLFHAQNCLQKNINQFLVSDV